MLFLQVETVKQYLLPSSFDEPGIGPRDWTGPISASAVTEDFFNAFSFFLFPLFLFFFFLFFSFLFRSLEEDELEDDEEEELDDEGELLDDLNHEQNETLD